MNDEVCRRRNGFHSLANAGKIQIIAPARALRLADDGRTVILSDGRRIQADAIVLATGYTSSWTNIFDSAYLSLPVL